MSAMGMASGLRQLVAKDAPVQAAVAAAPDQTWQHGMINRQREKAKRFVIITILVLHKNAQ